MKMYPRPVVLQTIQNMYNHRISPVGLDDWTRHTAVDGQDYAVDAIRGEGGVGHLEPVFSRDSCVGNFVVVVRAEIMVAPNAAIVGRVAIADGGLVTALSWKDFGSKG